MHSPSLCSVYQMQTSANFALTPSLIAPKTYKTKVRSLGIWKQKISKTTHVNCNKMFVPGFGEASPETKAAKNLHHFFTYTAVKIVAAQLESYNPEAYQDLMEFLSRNSLNDGDEFCAKLMRESSKHKSLALRILEVRSAYCQKDFEWENMKKVAVKMVNESNTKLMREYVLETSHVDDEK